MESLEDNSMVNFKMEIALDERRLSDDGYQASDIYRALEQIFANRNIKKDRTGLFVGNGTTQDFSNFGGVIIALKRKSWFMPYVSKWIWHTDTGVEDLVAHYKTTQGLRGTRA